MCDRVDEAPAPTPRPHDNHKQPVMIRGNRWYGFLRSHGRGHGRTCQAHDSNNTAALGDCRQSNRRQTYGITLDGMNPYGMSRTPRQSRSRRTQQHGTTQHGRVPSADSLTWQRLTCRASDTRKRIFPVPGRRRVTR
jgi:hypothetical protein